MEASFSVIFKVVLVRVTQNLANFLTKILFGTAKEKEVEN